MTPGEQVNVEISAYSQVYQSFEQQGTAPKITLNGNPLPQPKGPYSCTGAQVVVLDPTQDITNPASIRSNAYLPVQNDGGSWMDTYGAMWGSVVQQILTSGNIDQQIVFVATYGL